MWTIIFLPMLHGGRQLYLLKVLVERGRICSCGGCERLCVFLSRICGYPFLILKLSYIQDIQARRSGFFHFLIRNVGEKGDQFLPKLWGRQFFSLSRLLIPFLASKPIIDDHHQFWGACPAFLYVVYFFHKRFNDETSLLNPIKSSQSIFYISFKVVIIVISDQVIVNMP